MIGKFKDETAGMPITKFTGLKSKMYSYEVEKKIENEETKEVKIKFCEQLKAKGVKKYLMDNNHPNERYFNYSHFEDTLHEEKIIKAEMKCMRSDYHEMHNILVNKTSLSCYDDKRYIQDDGISSYAYGYYKI